MAKYTRKDIICFIDDPRLDNAIGKQVYGENSLTTLLTLANHGIWDETLAVIKKDSDFYPFCTYVEGYGYKRYDAIIIKKDEEENNGR